MEMLNKMQNIGNLGNSMDILGDGFMEPFGDSVWGFRWGWAGFYLDMVGSRWDFG
jgi:hypothetical protein